MAYGIVHHDLYKGEIRRIRENYTDFVDFASLLDWNEIKYIY